MKRRDRTHAIALELSAYGIASRRQLRSHGVRWHDVRDHTAAGRWRPLGNDAVRILEIPWDAALSPIAAGVFNASPNAWADGVSALLLHGLTGWSSDNVHVGLPHTARATRDGSTVSHRARIAPRIQHSLLPRAHRVDAALHAAAWAVSERAAATLLSMVVQQRIVRADALIDSLGAKQRLPRRKLIHQLLIDIANGSESLGELDFARLCRRHQIPLPQRQLRRRGPHGTYYLDAVWDDARLIVEIDGAHHYIGDNPTRDALRQNDLSLSNYTVLRVPLLALRSDPGPFITQIRRHLNGLGDPYNEIPLRQSPKRRR